MKGERLKVKGERCADATKDCASHLSPFTSHLSPIKELATLLSGSVLAQVISFAAYFVLLRIYSADDYGLFSIFYSYIEVLIILSTCKYEMAIVPATSDSEANAVARFAFRLNALVSLAMLAVLAVLTFTGSLPGKYSRLGWLAMLIAPMVFFCGTTRIYGELCNRRHRYRRIAAADITGAATGAVLKTIFGLLGLRTSGMPLGTVLGQSAVNLVYRLRPGERLKVNGERLKVKGERCADATTDRVSHLSPLTFHLSPYKNYPLYLAPKELVASLSSNLPFIWLALYFDNATVGLFALALTLVAKPVLVFSASCERILNARCSEALHHRQPIMPILLRFLLPVSVAAIAVAVATWFLAGPLVTFFFGGRWEGCEPYVRAMLPWAVVGVCSLSLMHIANIFSTQRADLIINIVQLLLRATAIAVGIHRSDFLLAIILFYAASALTALFTLLWYLYQTRRHDHDLTPLPLSARRGGRG